MKIYNTSTNLGLASLLYIAPSIAVAAAPSHDMSRMNHNEMTMTDTSDAMSSSMPMSDVDHKLINMSDMDHDSMNMSGMDHDSMDMTGMEHDSTDMTGMEHDSTDMSGMDHNSMDHGSMDMSGMQGGQPPSDARSPDYSNGVGYGKFGKPTMMGDTPTWGVTVTDLGYHFDDDMVAFGAEAWYGIDDKRVVLKSEGSIATEGDKSIDSLTSLSYWQPTSIFWNTHLGVAYDTQMDAPALMAGIEGTAPYFIETDANIYAYSDGQVKLEAGVEYEWRLTQHWVVIPEAEVSLFAKEDKDQHITKGFNELDTKVRLSYETLNRQLMPYIGISYETALGDNREQHRQHGQSVDSSSVIAGLSFWF